MFFLHHAIERLDLRAFQARTSDEGRLHYAPQLRLKIEAVRARGLEVYVPDVLGARKLAGTTGPVEMNRREQVRHPGLKQQRERMREPAARACYARRQALVEPVFGILKQQRGMRQFRGGD